VKERKHQISIESGSSNLEFMQYAVNYNKFITTIIRKNLPDGVNVLDFGAGNGEFAKRLAGYGFKLSVLEVEPKLCAKLINLGFQVLQGLEEVNDLSQSHIYSLNVLEHIHDDIGTLKSIHSKLTANGVLILYLPAFEILFSQMDKRVGHYRRYDKSSLKQILVQSGFKIEKIYYCDFIGFFATLLYKMIPKGNGEIPITLLRIYDRCIFPTNFFLDKLFGNFVGKNIFVVAHKVD
jgi:SAM-dependent methyltransferase